MKTDAWYASSVKTENPPLLFSILICRFLSYFTSPSPLMRARACVCVCAHACVRACVCVCKNDLVTIDICVDTYNYVRMFMWVQISQCILKWYDLIKAVFLFFCFPFYCSVWMLCFYCRIVIVIIKTNLQIKETSNASKNGAKNNNKKQHMSEVQDTICVC